MAFPPVALNLPQGSTGPGVSNNPIASPPTQADVKSALKESYSCVCRDLGTGINLPDGLVTSVASYNNDILLNYQAGRVVLPAPAAPAAIFAGYAQLMTGITTLTNLVNGLKGDVGQLKDDVRQIKDDVRQLKDNVRQLKDNVRQLKDNVRQLKDDASQVTSRSVETSPSMAIRLAVLEWSSIFVEVPFVNGTLPSQEITDEQGNVTREALPPLRTIEDIRALTDDGIREYLVGHGIRANAQPRILARRHAAIAAAIGCGEEIG